MKENAEDPSPTLAIAEPVIKQRRSISIVWLIPFVALIIGTWLAYTSITEKGPVITISFASAEGLEAGKTKVKYKSVDVGTVEHIAIDSDLSKVILTIQMNKESTSYLTDKTRFWVVRARVSASEVSGLSTLLEGAYIGIAPSDTGDPQKDFVGLEKVPLVTSSSKGKQFSLLSPRLGSLNPTSPIYFRQVQVGQVINYELNEQGKNITLNVFIDSPYDQFVREDTKFWLASGLDLQLSANGIKFNTESMISLMIGGIAFGTFGTKESSILAPENTTFTLYETRTDAQEEQYVAGKSYYYIEFFDSIRGLKPGAPVEFRGIQIGSVTDIQPMLSEDKMDFSIMVGIAINRVRLGLQDGDDGTVNSGLQIEKMIKAGLRAQLKTGNLLTGQLLVSFDYYPHAQEVRWRTHKDLLIIPSIPAATQEIFNAVERLVQSLEKLPIEEMGKRMESALTGLDQIINGAEIKTGLNSLQNILADLKKTTGTINAQTMPDIRSSLEALQTLLKEARGWISTDSPLQQGFLNTLDLFSKAMQSVNNLADMLERHPEALLQGKTRKDM